MAHASQSQGAAVMKLGEEWMLRALCRRVPALPWIAEPETVSDAQRVAMSGVCAACPVFFECADYVACEAINAGFWAGDNRSMDDRDASTASDGAA